MFCAEKDPGFFAALRMTKNATAAARRLWTGPRRASTLQTYSFFDQVDRRSGADLPVLRLVISALKTVTSSMEYSNRLLVESERRMTLAEIRRLVIVAMFSDDVLFERLVLKGGNALDLLYDVGGRTSLDIDFSIEVEFPDFDDVGQRIVRALQDRFDSKGFSVFDVLFERRPRDPETRSLGYRVNFKIIENNRLRAIELENPNEQQRLEAMRKWSEVIGPAQERKFTIEISIGEFCASRVEMDLDDYIVRVYTLAMIAIEKIRAICQQMAEYGGRAHPAPRARDFYDIHAIVIERGVDLLSEDSVELFRNIFAAKAVPLGLLNRIADYREFHRPDWPSVQNMVGAARELKDFDYYFDFLISVVQRLKSLGIVDAPL